MSEIKTSVLGRSVAEMLAEPSQIEPTALAVLERIITQNNRLTISQATRFLAPYDYEVYKVISMGASAKYSKEINVGIDEGAYEVYVSSTGRTHIRKCQDVKPKYSDDDYIKSFGYIILDKNSRKQIESNYETYLEAEEKNFQMVKSAMDHINEQGKIESIVDEVIGHVQHVESVGFYMGDKIYTMLERSENLITNKSNFGILNLLKQKPYSTWSDEEILLVCALKALFISGRSVRYEEFNGVTLTASSLLGKFAELAALYRAVGENISDVYKVNLFTVAKEISIAASKSVGAKWLRYRWVYGLSFYKTESILPKLDSAEPANIYISEFSEFYNLVVHKSVPQEITEHDFFRAISIGAIEKDVAKIACPLATKSAASWIEVLIEKIVSSAVVATNSDYGMSSALKNISRLLQPTKEALLKEMHLLKPTDFYTCFVSRSMVGRFDQDLMLAIAQSVQRRMMFNRWHFIPGNFDEALIDKSRHWYYPPVIPDIAIHSDVHRQAHSKAMVKFSIRSPGPDMTQSELEIGDHRYRGFYDVRVVRIDGVTYGTEEMLRTRRRTLWMGALFTELAAYISEVKPAASLVINGFEPGSYIDLNPIEETLVA